jgi:uncharacterized protein
MAMEKDSIATADRVAGRGSAQRHGTQELSVFGSAARGGMRPDSDVDVVVEFFPDVVHGWDYFRIERELAEVFGRPVDLATKKWMKPRVKSRVLPEARLIYAA